MHLLQAASDAAIHALLQPLETHVTDLDDKLQRQQQKAQGQGQQQRQKLAAAAPRGAGKVRAAATQAWVASHAGTTREELADGAARVDAAKHDAGADADGELMAGGAGATTRCGVEDNVSATAMPTRASAKKVSQASSCLPFARGDDAANVL